MKTIKILTLFYLALASGQALGMEAREASIEARGASTETPAGSPITSTTNVNFDSAPTSPIDRKRPLESAKNISWKQLNLKIAQNYQNLESFFTQIKQQKIKKAPAKDDDSESSSSKSSDDSDAEQMLKYL